MRIGVCGGRVNVKPSKVETVMDHIYEALELDRIEIAHGDAPGIDRASGGWAKMRRYPCMVIPVNSKWDGDRDDAPKQRNKRILDWLQSTPASMEAGLVGFPGGPGTRDMIQIAFDANITILDVEMDGDEYFVWRWNPVHGRPAKLICSGTF